jgi:hypothetical protein
MDELEKAYERATAELLGKPVPERLVNVARVSETVPEGVALALKDLLRRSGDGHSRFHFPSAWKLATPVQVVLITPSGPCHDRSSSKAFTTAALLFSQIDHS